jgi:phosphoribulokinase
VRWGDGEETWEPYENMAETKGLDEYERLHGRVIVDTVDAL